MPDFTVRSDAVNVEQIMEQIRSRIREKRGVDYTEEQIRELATVKLEKFLDPRAVRSDLLQQFQRKQAAQSVTSNITFGPNAIFDAQRPIVRRIRQLLHPVLRLFFNPDPISQALVRLNDIDPRADMYYELFHNLVIELTRTSIEVKNLKMRVESLTGRLEFNERRARALESVVVYKTTGDEAVGMGQPSHQGARTSQEGQSARGFQGSRGSQESRSAQQGSRGSQPSRSAFPLQGSQNQSPLGSPATTAPEVLASPPVTSGSQPPSPTGVAPSAIGPLGEGPGQRSRRRRRRRGRRGGGSAVALMTGAPEPPPEAAADAPPAGEASESDGLAAADPRTASTAFDADLTGSDSSNSSGDPVRTDSPSGPSSDSDPSGEQ